MKDFPQTICLQAADTVHRHLPNPGWPSDHLSLVADIEFTK
jgi:hypothetical protein